MSSLENKGYPFSQNLRVNSTPAAHTAVPTIPLSQKRLMLIEADVSNRKMLARELEIDGFTVYQAQDGTNAIKFMNQLAPDLIIADIDLPDISGFDFFRVIRENPSWGATPLIFMIPDGSTDAAQACLELGVEDYLFKPVEPGDLVRIVNARLLRIAELQVALIDQAYLETVNVLANTIEGRDPYTHGHIDRVASYSQWLAKALGWPKENLRLLAFGARLHDIGKIIIPDNILNKPGNLTLEEQELMKQHPVAGAKIIRNISHLQKAENYVLYHHERWDGSGYPEGLKGRAIPIEGRLLAIADVYDALTTTRPYHPARSHADVVKYLTIHAGTHFDPDLVPIFIQATEEQSEV